MRQHVGGGATEIKVQDPTAKPNDELYGILYSEDI